MKAILKPEDEVTVTPGKKAVEDLEGLATPVVFDDHLRFQDISTISRHGETLESYETLHVCRSGYATTIGMAMLWSTKKEFVPSSALTFAILREASAQHGPLGTKLEKDYASRRYLQNTIIDWVRGVVIHYPNGDDFAEKLPAMNRGIRARPVLFDLDHLREQTGFYLLEDLFETKGGLELCAALLGVQNPLSAYNQLLKKYDTVDIVFPSESKRPQQTVVTVGTVIGTSRSLEIRTDRQTHNAVYSRSVIS